MIDLFLRKFKKHKYLPTRTSSTGGQHYICIKCAESIYIPLEWSYQFTEKEIKKLKGCKG